MNGSSTAPNAKDNTSGNETAEDLHASNAATIASDSQGDLDFPNVLKDLEKELGGVSLSDTDNTALTAATSATLGNSESDPVGRDGKAVEQDTGLVADELRS